MYEEFLQLNSGKTKQLNNDKELKQTFFKKYIYMTNKTWKDAQFIQLLILLCDNTSYPYNGYNQKLGK